MYVTHIPLLGVGLFLFLSGYSSFNIKLHFSLKNFCEGPGLTRLSISGIRNRFL